MPFKYFEYNMHLYNMNGITLPLATIDALSWFICKSFTLILSSWIQLKWGFNGNCNQFHQVNLSNSYSWFSGFAPLVKEKRWRESSTKRKNERWKKPLQWHLVRSLNQLYSLKASKTQLVTWWAPWTLYW